MALAEGSVVTTDDGRSFRLLEPTHSFRLSQRWLAEAADGGRYEVLVLEQPSDGGPLVEDGYLEICNWATEQHPLDEGGRFFVFELASVEPLTAFIPPLPEAPRSAGKAWERIAGRLERVFALAELFELLHDVGEALICHTNLDMFAFREDGDDGVQAVLTRPELVFRLSEPPAPGSYKGSGIDAPEVCGLISRPVDQKADVYLLGMLAYTLLTGIRPVAGTTKVVNQLPPVRDLLPHVPLGLQDVIAKACSRTPRRRYPNVRAFIDALKAVERGAQRRGLSGEDKRMWVAYASHSAIGRQKMRRYPVNQDAHLEIFDAQTGWGLFAVMDGVSRSEVGRGEFASWLTSAALEEQWNAKRLTPIYGRVFDGYTPYPENFLSSLADKAHERVFQWLRLFLTDPNAPRGASTLCSTMSIVGVFRDRMALCNVGDSPVYLIRPEDDMIEQLSVDQSKALFLMRHGMSPVDALADSGANALSSAIGRVAWRGDDPVHVPVDKETTSLRLKPGDVILLVSDGVPRALGPSPERRILEIVKEEINASDGTPVGEAQATLAARRLVREADEMAGQDNLTATIVAISKHPRPTVED